MFKSRSLALIFATFCLMLLVAPLPAAADTMYSNSRASFTLPDGWTGPDSGDPAASGGVTYASADSSVAMNIVAVAPPDGSTLLDIVTASIAQFAMNDGYKADSDVKARSLGGEPAFTFAFTSNNSSGTAVSTITFLTLHSGSVYAVTFATTPDNEDAATPVAQRIIDSFKFM